ncbi:MAG: flagellar basal body rod protein FlgC [Planctomycetales bacterium 12-60-4]|nr:MAG: flagellar basal body rod protein FlgC [Planctomycetales bacterium 12-60-4]
MLRTLEISASGLAAQRLRMDTIAGNIAHSHTTMNEAGQKSPFQRRMVVLESQSSGQASGRGVGVAGSVEIDNATVPRKVRDPGHPHADAEGFVTYPNINVITEFVNALEATRAYEANLSAMQVTRSMIDGTFRLLG